MVKQTAGNNAFLKEVKRIFNTNIYKKVLHITNTEGHEAAAKELEEIKKYI